jgi:hypothetical protein
LIWALLALLGIPIWFIAVVLIAAFRNRKAVRSNPEVFDFKLRKDDGWQRSKSYARWVSDVFIIHTGIALIRSDAAQAESIDVLGIIDPPPKGFEESPTEVHLKFASGEEFSAAVSTENLAAMLGPGQNR